MNTFDKTWFGVLLMQFTREYLREVLVYPRKNRGSVRASLLRVPLECTSEWKVIEVGAKIKREIICMPFEEELQLFESKNITNFKKV